MPETKVVDQDSQIAVSTVLHHGDSRVRVKALRVTHDPRDDAGLSRPVALDHSDSFADLEMLPHLESPRFDLDRFALLSLEMDMAILDVFDYTRAVFELALDYLDPVSDLNRELRIISDGFQEGVVVEKIPLILILVLKLVQVRLRRWVYLEHLDLLQTGAYILCQKFVGCELLVEEAIPEHHFPPNVELFGQWPVELPLALVLHSQRIEQKLRHSNEFGLLCIGSHRVESLGIVGVEVFRHPGNESDHRLSISIDCLYEPKVILVDSSLDPYPLVDLEALLLGDLAALHDLGHLVDGYHLHTPLIDTAQPLQNFLHVLRLVSLAVDDAG